MSKKKLSISCMAHPSRVKYFPYLRERLGDIKFSVDDGRGLWENCKRAWEMYDPEAEFHLVVQDDAIVCEDFIKRAEKILRWDKFAYSFYYGKREKNRRLAKVGMKKGRIISRWLSWGIAICLPTKIIPDMLNSYGMMRSTHDDTRIAMFLRSRGIKTYFPMPSLIDHRPGESLVKDPGPGRKAWYFIDNENR